MAVVHIITGLQRTGKTLYLAYLANKYANDNLCLTRCHSLIDEYNAKGFHFSKPKTPVFTDFDIELHRPLQKPIHAYWINGFYLGLPAAVLKHGKNKQEHVVYRTMLLPPGIKIFLDEGNKFADSQNEDLMPDCKKRWIELMGQFEQELFLVAHRPTAVSKKVRDYADYTIFLKTDFYYNERGNISVVKMQYRRLENFQQMEAYLKSEILPNGNKIETLTIDCEALCNNIPAYYNTKFFDKYFLQGAKDRDFDLIFHQNNFSTPEDIDLFCKKYSYKVPKEIKQL